MFNFDPRNRQASNVSIRFCISNNAGMFDGDGGAKEQELLVVGGEEGNIRVKDMMWSQGGWSKKSEDKN